MVEVVKRRSKRGRDGKSKSYTVGPAGGWGVGLDSALEDRRLRGFLFATAGNPEFERSSRETTQTTIVRGPANPVPRRVRTRIKTANASRRGQRFLKNHRDVPGQLSGRNDAARRVVEIYEGHARAERMCGCVEMKQFLTAHNPQCSPTDLPSFW